MKKILPHEIPELVEVHRNFIGGVIAEGSMHGKIVSISRPNWIFNSDVNHSMFKVITADPDFDTPYVCVMNYCTFWGSN